MFDSLLVMTAADCDPAGSSRWETSMRIASEAARPVDADKSSIAILPISAVTAFRSPAEIPGMSQPAATTCERDAGDRTSPNTSFLRLSTIAAEVVVAQMSSTLQYMRSRHRFECAHVSIRTLARLDPPSGSHIQNGETEKRLAWRRSISVSADPVDVDSWAKT